MSDNKPMVDTSWELKWRRTLRKKLLNCLVLIENQGKPTQDLMYELRKAKEALTYWNSDTALWEKHQMVIPTHNQYHKPNFKTQRYNLSILIDILNLVCYN